MTIACILMTLTLVLSYYYLFTAVSSESLMSKILMAFVFASAQIVVTELMLGLIKELYLSRLIVLNLSCTTIVGVIAYKYGRNRIAAIIHNEVNSVTYCIKADIHGLNLVAATLVLLTYSWVVLAAYYLPPRGIDDLVYHLPTIFEYVQSHEIRLLPVTIRHHFAFPENAELLFMWPLIFTHSQKILDGLNVPFVLLSIAVVFALLRHFEIPRTDSLFASFLYALSPMVIMQAGSNYIDLMVAFFFLVSLYFALLFYKTQRLSCLYTVGVALGLMCGMKYTAIFLAIPLQVLIVPKIFGIKRRHLLAYFALIVVLGGWWYLRNTFVLSDPFYPLHLLGGHGGGGRNGIIGNIPVNMKRWLLFYPLDDVGIGSLDGGFGLVFWGLCFPAWIYVTGCAFTRIRTTGFPRFVLLAQLPIGFFLLLTVPVHDVDFCSRFAMFVLAVGLYAFCRILTELNDKSYVRLLKIVCILLSLAEISLMSVSELPTYQLRGAVSDNIDHKHPSEYKYFAGSVEHYVALRYIWEPLDFLTRDDTAGFTCRIASDAALFAAAPVYGSRLQNRVVNFSASPPLQTDAYVCMYLSKNIFGKRLPLAAIRLMDKANLLEIVSNRDYLVATQSDNGCLLLHKKIYNNPDKLKLLQTYYRDTWPGAVEGAKQIMPAFRENIPVVTSSVMGYGIRYHDIGNVGVTRVVMTPDGVEGDVAVKRGLTRCYSLVRPLKGYSVSTSTTVMSQGKAMEVYLNVFR
jgi:hypothetical protein